MTTKKLCTRCKGRGSVAGIGGIRKTCPLCSGTKFVYPQEISKRTRDVVVDQFSKPQDVVIETTPTPQDIVVNDLGLAPNIVVDGITIKARDVQNEVKTDEICDKKRRKADKSKADA